MELDNNLRFVANFMYTLKSNVTTDPLHYPIKKLEKLIPDIEESSKAQFDSICDRTMVGFLQNRNHTGTMEEHPVTCFYAEKDKSRLYESQVAGVNKTQSLNQQSAPGTLQLDSEDYHFIQTDSNVRATGQQRAVETPRARVGKKVNRFAAHKPSDKLD